MRSVDSILVQLGQKRYSLNGFPQTLRDTESVRQQEQSGQIKEMSHHLLLSLHTASIQQKLRQTLRALQTLLHCTNPCSHVSQCFGAKTTNYMFCFFLLCTLCLFSHLQDGNISPPPQKKATVTLSVAGKSLPSCPVPKRVFCLFLTFRQAVLPFHQRGYHSVYAHAEAAATSDRSADTVLAET